MSETTAKVRKSLARRYRQEKRFQAYGIVSIGIGLLALLILFTDIIGKGHSAFFEHYIQLEISLDPDVLGVDDASDDEQLNYANFGGVIKEALRERFPGVDDRQQQRQLYALVSSGASYNLRDELKADPSLLGGTRDLWLLADDDVDLYLKTSEKKRPEARLGDQQKQWIEDLEAAGDTEKRFNASFFSSGDSREPELAGIGSAIVGSFFTMLVTLCLSFPIGVAAAIYLEEFAPRNKFTDFIEVNINNLAAVPSIIFGLLGLAIFLQFFGLPRSSPLVGGMTLALMTLPVIIIATRTALRSVPDSIRHAAFGVGCSRWQMVRDHVLPVALPGIMTGSIIGLAQAMGETAPLIIVGMVAFIPDVTNSFTEAATVLPAQIFTWAGEPDRAFIEKTSGGILVLLSILITLNATAVVLRKKFERRW